MRRLRPRRRPGRDQQRHRETFRIATAGDYYCPAQGIFRSARYRSWSSCRRARQICLAGAAAVPGTRGPASWGKSARERTGGPAVIDRYDRSRNVIRDERRVCARGCTAAVQQLPSIKNLPPVSMCRDRDAGVASICQLRLRAHRRAIITSCGAAVKYCLHNVTSSPRSAGAGGASSAADRAEEFSCRRSRLDHDDGPHQKLVCW